MSYEELFVQVSVSGAGDSRERTRQYYADYTFDSSCPITQPSYASQEKVSVFAYLRHV